MKKNEDLLINLDFEALFYDVAGQSPKKKMKSPFRTDNNASFSVDISAGTYYDHATKQGGNAYTMLTELVGLSNVEAVEKLKEHQIGGYKKQDVKPKIVKEYEYTDIDGNYLFTKVRKEPKAFNQYTVKNGKKVYSLAGVEKVLYNLPNIVKSDTVYIVEGEKDVENLNRLGVTATCNFDGAGKWLDSYNECLAGKDIIIIPDSDEAGRKHLNLVHSHLEDVAKSLKVIKLPNNFKDVSDYLDDIDSIFSDLIPEPYVVDSDLFLQGDLMTQTFAPLKWVIPDIMPEGLCIFGGSPKIGKSWLWLDIAYQVAIGGSVLGRKVEQGTTAYFALEDSQRRLQDRLSKIGVTSQPKAMKIGLNLAHLIEGGFEDLEVMIKTTKPKVVILDTMGKVSPNLKVYMEETAFYTKLQDLTKKYRTAIVCITHTTKMKNDDEIDNVRGSKGNTGVADTIITLSKARGDNSAELRITGRDVEENAYTVSFNNFKWEMIGQSSFTESLTDERFDIVQILGDSKMHYKDIAAKTGKTESSIKMSLTRMVKDGQIQKLGKGYYAGINWLPSDDVEESISTTADEATFTVPTVNKTLPDDYEDSLYSMPIEELEAKAVFKNEDSVERRILEERRKDALPWYAAN